MTPIAVILLMLLAGVIGGVVNTALAARSGKSGNWVTDVLAGVGASFLMPLFLRTVSSGLLADVLNGSAKADDIFVFSSFCLLAAISSKAFINTLSDKVLREVGEVRRQGDIVALKSQAYSAALAVMAGDRPFADRDNALQMLRAAKEALGDIGLVDRQINLSMGRIERVLGRYDEAIQVLSGFIGEKEKRKQLDVDLGDAYYNRACYHLLRTTPLREAEKELAYADLAKAIRFNEGNKTDAVQDEDFASIKGEARFRELVGTAAGV